MRRKRIKVARKPRIPRPPPPPLGVQLAAQFNHKGGAGGSFGQLRSYGGRPLVSQSPGVQANAGQKNNSESRVWQAHHAVESLVGINKQVLANFCPFDDLRCLLNETAAG